MKPTDMLTPHFRLAEFLHGGSMEGVTLDIIENLRLLSQKLEAIRELLGKPIVITSGFRTAEHNRSVGGAKFSQHLYGKAADIVVPGLSPAEVLAVVKGHWEGGIGYYPDKPRRKGWLHLDTGLKRYWEG